MARPRKEGASKSSIKRRKPDKYLDPNQNKERVVPELPDPAQWLDPGATEWPNAVVNWWQDIFRSPMASEWVEADLGSLYLAATYLAQSLDPHTPLKDRIKAGQCWEASLKAYGLTPRSRELLRWSIAQGEAAQSRTRELRGNRAPSKGLPTTRAVVEADDKIVQLYSKYS